MRCKVSASVLMANSRTETRVCNISTYGGRSLEEKLECLLLASALWVIFLIKLSINWPVDDIFFGNIVINVFEIFLLKFYTTELVA